MRDQKQSFTIDQGGALLTIEQDGISMPADYSFACVNDYIHAVDRHFEELQCLALGMAGEIERVSVPQDPVAYAVFSESGNIQVWCADPTQTKTLRQKYGPELKPLYANPQPSASVSALVEALARCRHQASYTIGSVEALSGQLNRVRDIANEALATYRNHGGKA